MQMGWWYLCFFVRCFGSLYTRRYQRGAVKGVIPALSSQYTSSSDQCIFGKMLGMNQEWRLLSSFFYLRLLSLFSIPSPSPPLEPHHPRIRTRERAARLIPVCFAIGHPGGCPILRKVRGIMVNCMISLYS